MLPRRSIVRSSALLGLGVAAAGIGTGRATTDNGVRRVRSSYPMAETIARVKQDIAAKGITFFAEIDQATLAGKAGIALHPSTLLIFGNPGLGSHFITADAAAGLDWPVRLLVYRNDKGEVWMAWTDFQWIAGRHGITSRDKEFAMATAVVTSITSAAVKAS
jgi:uncharacterized protein (DUF302 family)